MTLEYFQPVLDWIVANPTWAGFIVFLISLIESLAIIGLIIPGTPVMFAIGLMMGTGDLPFWQTMLWAIFGAIVGDGVSYWLGHRFHEQLRDFWPFRQFPKILEHGEKFFKNHGGKSIILGRFGPVRPVIPVIAGMMDMQPKPFLFFNIVSAFIWAPAYTLPGVLVGMSLGSLSPEVAQRAVLLALLVVLALWLIYMFLRIMGAWIAKLIQKSLSFLWQHISNHYQILHKVFRTAQGTEEGQLGITLVFLFATAGFFTIWIDVYYGMSIIEWNEAVYQALRALYSEKTIAYVAFFTQLGSPWVLLPAVVSVGLWLLWRGRSFAAFCWLATIGMGFLLGDLVKIITKIPRPEGLANPHLEHAFPSGHTLAALLTFGLATAFIHHTIRPKYRWIPWAITTLLIIMVAFSRLYLGLHWFTDILGSVTLGTSCVALGTLVYRRFAAKPIPLRDIIIPGVLVISVALTLHTSLYYSQMQKDLMRQWPIQTLDQKNWWQGKGNNGELYRTGALKRHATLFDIQWLGSLASVKTTLEKAGWKEVPKISLTTVTQILTINPLPTSFPVMPKFHRDRLPVLTVVKAISNSKRLVLQLWQSDYMTPNQVPLWVATLRQEETSHPLPLITLYLETDFNGDILNQLTHDLSVYPNIHYHILNVYHNAQQDQGHRHYILLIKTT
jgi:undecaprenyl-diphosphatase